MKFPLFHIGIKRGFKKSGKGKHSGIDFGWHGDKNPPVYSIEEGEVVYYKKQPLGGYAIRIRHYKNKDGKYVYSEYGHLLKGSIKVKVGDKIKKYQHIANMGKSGVCNGEHLHLTMYIGTYSNKVDPLKYLCLYDDQEVTDKTKKNYKINYTKKVKGTDGYLAIRNQPRSRGKQVGRAKEGSQVECFGITNGWNICDNLRDYYCFDKYLK